ncbi:MAG: hypothetical protein OEW00_05235 [candidate division Zixibacteria bacterium]|nr:hypothetical protein [candidate division Zixibacteria bacterium]
MLISLKKILLSVTLLLLTSCASVQAQLRIIETDRLRLIYFETAQSFLAPYAARCFHNAMDYHQRLWDYSMSEKATIFLYDFSDYGNAGAKNVPKVLIPVGIAPFNYSYETMPANERINTIMNHELVHVVATDRTAASDRFFRTILLGKTVETSDNPLSVLYSYLTAPRRSAPSWYHEGIAVFLETWMAGGYGRALGAYDEMVFRTKVRDSAHIYDRLGLESEGTKIDFMVGVNSYLYGARFADYLALHYGPRSLIDWVRRSDGSKAYFASQFKQVFGLPLDRAWDDWIEFEHSFQRTNLDSIRQYPVTPYRDISRRALGSVSRSFYDSGRHKIYCAVNYPGQVAHLAAIDYDTGEIYKIKEIKGPALYYVTSLAWDAAGGTLFYTTDNNAWRDIVAVDVETDQSRTLLKDARVGDLAFNPADSSLWGVRHSNGISTLVRIPPPYKEWNKIYIWPYGRDLYDIDLSPDGRLLVGSLAEVSGRQTLVMMETDRLLDGDSTFTTLHDFGNSIPANFVFSQDGQYLFGSSYYTGVSNIFRYDLNADSMDAVSNCETGFFRPMPVSADSVIVFRYTGDGFLPAVIEARPLENVSPIVYLGQRVVDEHPELKEWMLGSPADVPLDSLIVDTGHYHGLSGIDLTSAYPVVEGYKHYTAVGYRLNFSDPVEMHHSDLTVSYTPASQVPSDERWHVRWNYDHFGWSLDFKYNGADFYDLFGPTKTSRKGYVLGGRRTQTLVFDGPREAEYSAGVTWYTGLEKLPDYQNIATFYDEFFTFDASLSFKNLRASYGAIDYEKGHDWELMTSGTLVNGKLHPRVHGGFSLGLPLPLHHTSVWFRGSTGYAYGDRADPFANFYFGGFGNNWVDRLAVQRYRSPASFPGTDLNAIAGKNFGKFMTEISLPPVRFRRFGIPSFYMTYARTALFATGIVTNYDRDDLRRVLANAGAQIDFRFEFLSHLRLTLSVGYATAFEENRKTSDEFMVSLKLL